MKVRSAALAYTYTSKGLTRVVFVVSADVGVVVLVLDRRPRGVTAHLLRVHTREGHTRAPDDPARRVVLPEGARRLAALVSRSSFIAFPLSIMKRGADFHLGGVVQVVALAAPGLRVGARKRGALPCA